MKPGDVVLAEVGGDVKHHDDKREAIASAKPGVEDASKVTTAPKGAKRKHNTTKVEKPVGFSTRNKLSDSKPGEQRDVVSAIVTKGVDGDQQSHEGDKTKVAPPARTEVKDEEDASVATGNAPSETAKSECGTKPSEL